MNMEMPRYNPFEAKVYEQDRTMVSDNYMNVCKSTVYYERRMREVSGPFGTVYEIAPNTFVKKYSSECELLEDLRSFRKVAELIPPIVGKRNSEYQSGISLGYFTFDNPNEWFLVFGFRFGMKGPTDECLLDGAIVNPAEYLKKSGIEIEKNEESPILNVTLANRVSEILDT